MYTITLLLIYVYALRRYLEIYTQLGKASTYHEKHSNITLFGSFCNLLQEGNYCYHTYFKYLLARYIHC